MIVATYSKLEDAQLAVSLLEGNGIDAYIRDGNTVHTYWFYANAIGGVKVEVAEEDATRALEVLDLPPAEPNEISLLQCPHCGSGHTRLRELNLFSALCLGLGFLVPLRSKHVDCLDCEQSFRLSDSKRPA